MSPYPTVRLPRFRTCRLAAIASCTLFVIGSPARADTAFGVAGSPIDLIAQVHDAHNPGGTVFSDNQTVVGATPSPKQSAEYLYLAPIGQNLSGRSTNITRAFASSLAESDGNGGVGVSSWIAAPAVPNSNATDQLVAQAVWGQTFTNNGSEAALIKLHLEIPAIQVGLIGVAPNRSAVSKTESADAKATVTSFITHADSSRSNGGSFEYGMRAEEFQIPLGPGTYANFADIAITNNVFSNILTFTGNEFNPSWILDPVSTSVTLGTLAAGEAITYEYTLTAQGTTLGFEHGYLAFIGDPFGVDVVGGNLTFTAETVPIPAACGLFGSALAGLGFMRRRASIV
jgi:hypothetical protein